MAIDKKAMESAFDSMWYKNQFLSDEHHLNNVICTLLAIGFGLIVDLYIGKHAKNIDDLISTVFRDIKAGLIPKSGVFNFCGERYQYLQHGLGYEITTSKNIRFSVSIFPPDHNTMWVDLYQVRSFLGQININLESEYMMNYVKENISLKDKRMICNSNRTLYGLSSEGIILLDMNLFTFCKGRR